MLGTVVCATAYILGRHMCTIGMDLTAHCAMSARVTDRYLDQCLVSSSLTTPAEVVEEGSGLGRDAGLGGHLLGADGDSG